jgi:hypothetical protein
MAKKPADMRHNLIRKMCYEWIRKYEPVTWMRFKRIAQIEYPVKKCRGRGQP